MNTMNQACTCLLTPPSDRLELHASTCALATHLCATCSRAPGAEHADMDHPFQSRAEARLEWERDQLGSAISSVLGNELLGYGHADPDTAIGNIETAAGKLRRAQLRASQENAPQGAPSRMRRARGRYRRNNKASRMEFDVTEYVFAHGKSPKGRGRWAFAFDGNETDLWWSPNDTPYGQAKLLARSAAPAGTNRAKVMP